MGDFGPPFQYPYPPPDGVDGVDGVDDEGVLDEGVVL